jgi:hypothetical protein
MIKHNIRKAIFHTKSQLIDLKLVVDFNIREIKLDLMEQQHTRLNLVQNQLKEIFHPNLQIIMTEKK